MLSVLSWEGMNFVKKSFKKNKNVNTSQKPILKRWASESQEKYIDCHNYCKSANFFSEDIGLY
jgi:hypothetical protein